MRKTIASRFFARWSETILYNKPIALWEMKRFMKLILMGNWLRKVYGTSAQVARNNWEASLQQQFVAREATENTCDDGTINK